MATQLYAAIGGVRKRLSGGVPTVTAPGQAAIVAITAGAGQVTVDWVPPISNGGSAITGYTVTLSTGGTATVGAGIRTATVSSTNGTAVTATVTATNVAGSTVSAVSAAVTPVAAPIVKPTANLTGVPVGASGDTRTAFPGGLAALTVADGVNGIIPAALSGKMAYDATNKVWRLSAANQTFDGFHFKQPVWLNANTLNPTFTRCKFTLTPPGTGAASSIGMFGHNGRAWGTLTISDCEYDGGYTLNGGVVDTTDPNPSGPYGWYAAGPLFSVNALGTDVVVVSRCNIHHTYHGIDIQWSNVTAQDCYIHDLAVFHVPNNANPTTSIDITHTDGIQFYSTGAVVGLSNVLIQRNNIDMTNSPANMTGGIQCGHFGPGSLQNIRIVDNWLNTNSTYSFSGGTPWPAGPNDILVDRNRIGLANRSQAYRPGYPPYWGANNVWDQTGITAGGTPVVAGQAIP